MYTKIIFLRNGKLKFKIYNNNTLKLIEYYASCKIVYSILT